MGQGVDEEWSSGPYARLGYHATRAHEAWRQRMTRPQSMATVPAYGSPSAPRPPTSTLAVAGMKRLPRSTAFDRAPSESGELSAISGEPAWGEPA